MGRPKVDHSHTICDNCGKAGNYAAKGLCRVCYGHQYFKETAVGEKLDERRANSRQWNQDNRDHRNALRRGDVLPTPRGIRVAICEGCTELLPIYSKNRCVSCYGKWRHKNRTEETRLRSLASRYNLSYDELLALHGAANGKCKICKLASDHLVIDHNHKNGKVRDLLCQRCNTLLGWLEIAPIPQMKMVVAAAFDYLETHSQEPTNAPNPSPFRQIP